MSDAVGFTTSDEALKTKDEEEFLGTLRGWHDYAKTNRQPTDWGWYINEQYYHGNHYVQFNRVLGRIVTPKRPKGQVRLTVNKIYSICRAIRNFATSYRPKWDVIATSTDEEEINNSRKSAELLDYYYDYLDMPKKIKGACLHAIKYGAGFFQYGWDDGAVGIDDQKGECFIDIIDPFDLYLDPVGMQTGNIQNCRYADKVVSIPVQDIINNPNYKKVKAEEIAGSTELSASVFKNTILKNKFSTSSNSTEELKTVLLHETWYKEQKKTKDEDGNNSLETKVWVASWIDGHLLRREETEFSKYPIIHFASDDNPNEIYGEGYVKHLIPIIKVLNRLESQVVEYNNSINRGRFKALKDSGYNKITDENGEIVEVNDMNAFAELRIGGLAPDIHQQIQRLNQYLDDISGVTDAFKGNIPSGVTAGVAIESLKAQSANNLQDLKDNLEVAISELGEGVLEMISMNVVAPRQIRSKTDGKNNYFKIKGQVGLDFGNPESDAYIIGKQNQVKVSVGSALAYTREGRITRLNDLYDRKIIGPETYLKYYEFGDIEGVLDEAKKVQVDQAMMSNIEKNGLPGMQPMQNGQPQQGMPPQGQGMPPEQSQGMLQQGEPDNMLKLAEDENEAMQSGEEIPGTPGATREHTAVHVAFSQSPQAQGDEALLTRLLQHIKEEEAQQGMGQEVQNAQ